MVRCGKCAFGKSTEDKKTKTIVGFLTGLTPISDPTFVCELDGKRRLGIDGCDKGKDRKLEFRDLF